MSDRTFASVTIVACPTEHIRAVLAVLDTYGLDLEFGAGSRDHPLTAFVLGELYIDDQMACGSSSEIAGELAALAGVAFCVQEDPRYEWLGQLHYVLADGRAFWSEGDAQGNCVMTGSAYRSLRDSCPDPGTLRDALDEAFGSAIVAEYEDLFGVLGQQPEEERTRPLGVGPGRLP